MTLKIETGKFYRTRDGRKVGPVFLWCGAWSQSKLIDDYKPAWFDDGRADFFDDPSPEYDLIAEWTDEPAAAPEVGTLRELNVKPGDVVECVSVPGNWAEWTVGKRYTATSDGLPCDRNGPQLSSVSEFRIISRASDAADSDGLEYQRQNAPLAELPYGHALLPSGEFIDLTAITAPFGLLPADVQQALRDHGGPWEWYDGSASWIETLYMDEPALCFVHRVRPLPPEPKVEDVVLYGRLSGSDKMFASYLDECSDTHRITLTLRDGVPDPVAKVEPLA